MRTKKSAIDLTEIALGLLILGIVVFIGADLLNTFRDNRLDELDTYEVANETLTPVNETGSYLANDWVSGVDDCVNGSTDATLIDPGNYTFTANANSLGTATVTFNDGADPGFNGTQWDCTYNVYNVSRPDWDLPNSAAAGVGEYGNWFDIIAIVGIAGLILTLIFMSFGRKEQGLGISY